MSLWSTTRGTGVPLSCSSSRERRRKKDLGAPINNWLAETSHWISPQEETEQTVLTEETQDTKLIWNDLFNVIVPVLLDVYWCASSLREKLSNSLYVFTCTANKTDPDRTWSWSWDSRRCIKYWRSSREATNTKTWKLHTVSWRAPKISYQLRVRPHVKYGHSRLFWSWVMALSNYQK